MDCKAVFVISIVLVFSVSVQAGIVKIPKSHYVWKPYPEETLPMFQKAFQDIAASRSKMALLYHAWNILPQNGIYVAPDDSIASNDFQDRLGMAFSGLDEGQAGPSAALIGGENVDGRVQIVPVRGTPGEDFPNYHDVPETSFKCSEQGYIPGFYADLETGCQAFHVCWPHKKDTLLCPIGTLFNQAILSCDYWYAVNCSLAPLLYDLNARVPEAVFYHEDTPSNSDKSSFVDWTLAPKFHPVASKTEVYPEGAGGNTLKRRHVPKEATTTTTTAAAEDYHHQQEEQSAPARLLPEISTSIPLRKSVLINSKFSVQPLFVIRREVWQKKLKDMVEEVAEGTEAEGTTPDVPVETLCGVPRQRLASLIKELVIERIQEMGDRDGSTESKHAKDPGVEVEDFSESFEDVASSPDKVKATFRILNAQQVVDDQQVGSGDWKSGESDGSGSFDEYLRSLEQKISVLRNHEGSGSFEELEEPMKEFEQLKNEFKFLSIKDYERYLEVFKIPFPELDNPVFIAAQIYMGEDLLLQHRVGYAPEVHPEEFGKEPIQAGSIRGIPGVHFPDYEKIPITSFSCDDEYVPGFYADLETGCQAFHVCWPHKKDTLLCPIGTLFNQAILSCDYWYAVNCSLAPLLYDLNARVPEAVFYHEDTPSNSDKSSFVDWTLAPKFHPVASKTEVYPEGAGGNTLKRRHVPKEATTTTTTAAAEDYHHQQEEQSAPARLLPEISTSIPLRKSVLINSKFSVQPLFVIRREVWQKKLKDMVEEVAEGTEAEGTTPDVPVETLCGVPRQRLASLIKELVIERIQEMGDRDGSTESVQ